MDAYHILTLVFMGFSAVGTVLSAAIALGLARRDMRRRIDAVFIWDDNEKSRFKPTVLVQNSGKLITVIESISIHYNKKRIGYYCLSKDQELCKRSIVEAGKSVEIPLNSSALMLSEPKNVNKQYVLTIKVRPRRGRVFVTKQHYSYNELLQLMFMEAFTSSR